MYGSLYSPKVVLSSFSINAGDGGNLIVNTRRLLVRDGGRLTTSTYSTGNAKTITVNASESVEVSGVAPNSQLTCLIIDGVEFKLTSKLLP